MHDGCLTNRERPPLRFHSVGPAHTKSPESQPLQPQNNFPRCHGPLLFASWSSCQSVCWRGGIRPNHQGCRTFVYGNIGTRFSWPSDAAACVPYSVASRGRGRSSEPQRNQLQRFGNDCSNVQQYVLRNKERARQENHGHRYRKKHGRWEFIRGHDHDGCVCTVSSCGDSRGGKTCFPLGKGDFFGKHWQCSEEKYFTERTVFLHVQ
mmetsp:Transcript_11552/g.16408  ORF Transcript_11552/g.16408 Transcript_11552/m.16408 type:complete len:207 (+) Transcript_11552:99-719(+)